MCDHCRSTSKARPSPWRRLLPALEGIARRDGTPFYAYDRSGILGNLRALQDALTPKVRLMYAMKANPNVEVVRLVTEAGAGVEVASAGELLLALRAGASAADIVMSGPGKTASDHESAVSRGIGMINVESLAEARRLAGVASRLGKTVKVALRVNPRQGIRGARLAMGGCPSQFGIDEERADKALARISAMPGLVVAGIHVFAGTQVTDAEAMLEHFHRCVALARRLCRAMPQAVLNVGGGFGVGEQGGEMDLPCLASGMAGIARECGKGRTRLKLMAEPGRFIVSSSGCYVSGVVEVKRSRGRWFVILDGGINHRAAAGLNGVIRRDPQVWFPRHRQQAVRQGCLVGPLCTPLDRLAEAVDVPAGIRPGDLVVLPGMGAYCRSAAPMCFLSHDWPAEYMLGPRGAVRRISRRVRADDIWDLQRD
jgi:diaminopimelate decarboxylase